jgi:plastocyanin
VQPAPTNLEPTPKARPTRWRIAALGAATSLALAACGASAAGPGSTSAPTTASPNAPAAVAPSSPTSSGPSVPTGAAPDPATTTKVGIVNFAFTPAALTVKVGTTVVWTNNDAIAHTVNFTTDGINSKVLNKNDEFTHTFSTPGTYAYICSIHPFMHGSVTVTA